MEAKKMYIGEPYNFTNQKERLVYIGCNLSGNGFWHQFEKISNRGTVWSELQGSDLWMIEETKGES